MAPNTAPALIVTSLALVTAFGAFSQGQFLPLRDFGVMVSFILTVAVVTGLIVLPALLMRPVKSTN